MTDLPIYLRPPETEDTTYLYKWENDPENRVYSPEEATYSKAAIREFIANAMHVKDNRQMRLMICLRDGDIPIGTIDLFDIDFYHRRAGIGILIADKNQRRKQYASFAIELIEELALKKLNLVQLHCLIQLDNAPSIHLFEKCHYSRSGTLKKWFKRENIWYDAYFYQKMIDSI
ncbi:MAG: GNAT family N-acetyltransferase [Bacteroidota bacterium]